jgi:hypothetical protein
MNLRGALPLILSSTLISASSVSAMPANDNVAAAQFLGNSAFVSQSGSNIDATIEAGESTAPFNRRNKSVWYSWVAPSNGNFQVDIKDANFDTIVAVQPLNVFNFTQRSTSKLVFPAVSGNTYFLAVCGFSGELNDSGQFSFTISPAPLPRAELVSAAFSADPTNASSTVVSTLNINAENGFESGNIVLRTTTGRLLGEFPFDGTSRTSGDAKSGTYNVNLLIPTFVAPQTLNVEYSLNAIDGYAASYGQGYEGNQPIPAAVDTALAINNTDTTDTTAPQLTSISASATTVDLTGDTNVTFNLTVTDNLSGFREGSLILINQDALGDPTNQGRKIEEIFTFLPTGNPLNGTHTTTIDATLPVGSYFIYVALDDNAANRRTVAALSLPGPFNGSLNVISSGAPANDNFANATILTGADFSVNGNTTGATLEFEETTDSGKNSVWYRWQAPVSGLLQLAAVATEEESDIFSIVEVIEGSNVFATTLITSNGDGPYLSENQIYVSVISGQTYLFRVSTFDPSGSFILEGKYTVPDAPILNSISATPPIADVSGGSVDVTIEMNITSSSPLQSGRVFFFDHLGNYLDDGYSSQDFNNSTLVIPANLAPFPLTLGVYLEDMAGNTTYYGSNALPLPEGFSAIPVTNTGTVDLEDPWVFSHSISPNPVDISGGSQTVTINFTVGDDVGIPSHVIELYDQNENFVEPAQEIVTTVVSTSGRNTTYSVEFVIPALAAAGEDWTYYIDVYDTSSNYNGVIGFFEVISSELAPPVISAANVTPDPVVVDGITAVTPQIEITFTDDSSGLDTLDVTVRNPEGNTVATRALDSNSITTGTSTSGTIVSSFTIPGSAPSGTYTLHANVTDFAGQEATNVSIGSFQVSNTEVAAPSVTSATVDPNPVTVNGVDAESALLDIAFTDDGSGLASLNVAVKNSGGSTLLTHNFTSADIATGTATSGTFSSTITIPGTSATGTYAIFTTATDTSGRTATDVSSGTFNINNTEIAAPVVTLLTVTPSPVMVDGMTAATPTIRLDFTDDGSGMSTMHADIKNAAGDIIDTLNFTAAQIMGTAINGYFEGMITIPGLTPGGTYSVFTNSKDAVNREANNVLVGTFQIENSDLAAPMINTEATVIPMTVYFDGTTPNAAQLQVGFTDDGSGLTTIQIVIRAPNGAIIDTVNLTSAEIASGSSTNGTFLVNFTIPGSSPVGTYTATATVTDAMGQQATDISLGSFQLSIEAAPQITGLSVVPSPVDVNDATTSATLQISFTDDHSGLQSMKVTVAAPDGRVVAVNDLTTANISAGNAVAGTVETTVQFGKFSPPGVYTVKANARDVSGVLGSDLTVGSFALTNSGTAANAINTMTSFSISPASLTITPANQTLIASVGLSANADVQTVRLMVYRPDGVLFYDANASNTVETPLTYSKSLVFGRYSAPGTWHIDVEITHTNGMKLLYSNKPISNELFADTRLPIPTELSNSFSVTSTLTPDLNPPTLSGLWFAPATVNTLYQNQNVTVNLAWADDFSGFNSASIDVHSASDTYIATFTINYNNHRILGGSALGAGTRSITIPQGTEPGELKFVVRLYDEAGNRADFDNTFPVGTVQGLTVTAIANYNVWITGFPSISNQSKDQDPDFDGLSTYLEFLLDLDPTNGMDSGAPALRIEGANIQLAYKPGPNFLANLASGGNVAGQTSPDLINWMTTPVTSLGDGYFGISKPMGDADQVFMRLIEGSVQEKQ